MYAVYTTSWRVIKILVFNAVASRVFCAQMSSTLWCMHRRQVNVNICKNQQQQHGKPTCELWPSSICSTKTQSQLENELNSLLSSSCVRLNKKLKCQTMQYAAHNNTLNTTQRWPVMFKHCQKWRIQLCHCLILTNLWYSHNVWRRCRRMTLVIGWQRQRTLRTIGQTDIGLVPCVWIWARDARV